MAPQPERTNSPAAATAQPDGPWLARPADPPRPHRWLLVASIALLAVWMAFLAYLALRPS